MADGPIHVAALREPLGAARAVQPGGLALGAAASQLDPEQLGKQAVVAVPLASLVERRDEDIGPLDLRESGGGIRPIDQRVGKGPTDGVHDGRREHEVEGLRVERIEDLLHEVVEDVAVRGPERLDECAAVRSRAHRQIGEIKPRRPALGPLMEHLDRVRVEVQRQAIDEELGGLLGGEREIAGPDLEQLAVARSRATGSGGSVRVEITSWTVRGASSANRVRA